MLIGTILKFSLGLIGMISTLVFFFAGLINKDNSKLKKAGLVFLATWLVLLLLSAFEFLILAA